MDKKAPNNIRYYKNKPSQDDQGDIMQMISLLLGIVAFIFKVKWCCWLSLLFLLSAYVNSKYNSDQKQMMMNFSLILMGFFMVYIPQRQYVPTPAATVQAPK